MGSSKCGKPNPKLEANAISRIFFWWLNPLFWYGQNHDLEQKDLYHALPSDKSEKLGDQLERYWNKELEDARGTKRVPDLLRAIRRTFIYSYLPFAGYVFVYAVIFRPLQPFILGRFIQYFEPESTSTTHEAVAYAVGIIVLGILQALNEHHCILGQSEIGMRVRIACSSLVYRKITRLSSASATKLGGGMVTNLLSNDVTRFETVFLHMHYLWAAPLQISVITYLLWQSVGISSFAGIFLLILQTAPVQAFCGVYISRIRSRTAFRTDESVRQMTEVVSGIRVIKMYAWEQIFQKFVTTARRHELNAVRIYSYVQGLTIASFVFTERATLYFTILAYVLQGNIIKADKLFSMAQYYNVLQATIIFYLFEAISTAAQTRVSINRIQQFLLMDEVSTKISDLPEKDEHCVSLKDVSASWNEDLPNFTNTLQNLTIDVPANQLLVLLGPVGAGKSSFLKLLMSELRAVSGTISVRGIVSYCSQNPWLFSGSVRNNILFGEKYDEEKYKRVLDACSLIQDMDQLPYGDKTIVGDSGVNLSGGQCARINLARAVYKDAEIYLLDDPFSAIDINVGLEVFKNCIQNYLQHKTRILVVHQTQYLKDVDSIVLMKNGCIKSQGAIADVEVGELNVHETSGKINLSVKKEDRKALLANFVTKTSEDNEPEEMKELISKGNLPKTLYWTYFSTGASHWILTVLLLSQIVTHLIIMACDYWPAYWVNQQQLHTWQNTNFSFDGGLTESGNGTFFTGSRTEFVTTNTALMVYGALLLGTIIMCIIKNILFYEICLNASKNFHSRILTTLLKAPLRFFDTHTAGEILNRFSKDMGRIDEFLPTFMMHVIQAGFVTIGIMLQVFIVEWRLIFIAAIICYIYWKIKNIYLATAQDLKRLEAITKSPLISYANSSLLGLLTIRSSRAQAMTCKQFDAYQDDHTSAYFLYIATTTSFSFWMEIVSVMFMGFVVSSFLILDNNRIYAGNVGLALSQTLILTVMFHHAMQLMAVMHTQMTSVERIVEYTKLDEEGPFNNDLCSRPGHNWPSEGNIQFNNVYLRYSNDGNLALKNINISVKSGEKIGIVGRTGAGKSSLITALFRLAEFDGFIFIDSCDIRNIGLTDLRRKMSIIPQKPMLFSGTIRKNLDPLNEFEDDALWLALQEVEMNRSIASLDHTVGHDGGNLSAGEKQLLCLARVILRNNKILVLDEATANVDPDTSALVQKTIRQKFEHCTVLTIAHRLHVVMDSDKVLVMNDGEAVEFGHPYSLLQQRGYFYNMVQQSGVPTADLLTDISKNAYILQNEDLRQ